MNAATCQALRTFLEEQIEAEEAILWDDKDLAEDTRQHLIKEQETTLLRLNQLMDLVHAAYQEAD